MNRKTSIASETRLTRCAIYCRVSTEEGLGQDFNSLDAQRESGEAFVHSRKPDGWTYLPNHYDDGGFSGATLERPALARLLADIKTGLVDCIVVYKVDRLSRSLLDFARLVEVLDAHSVSFVSVTQPINTADSAGRLMLNVLLSFAQYERELIADRTSDKMSAARRKGKWTGGTPVLGYDVHPDGGKILVNENEAVQVREIFRLYLKHQSISKVCAALEQRGITTKSWTTRKGLYHEGGTFTKSTLQRHLANATYIGKVDHRGQTYPGEHEGIVPVRTFNKVQKLIAANRQTNGGRVKGKYGFLLRGLVKCSACDSTMSPSTSRKGARVYRYYVCSSAQKKGYRTCRCPSIPAQKLEVRVIDQIRTVGQDPGLQKRMVTSAQKLQRAERTTLEAQHRRLEKKLAKVQDQIAELVTAISRGTARGDLISARLDELADKAETLQRELTKLDQQISALKVSSIDKHDLAEALSLFDPIWEVLYPTERTRITQLLIDRIDFRGKDTPLGIKFSPVGVRLLSNEIATATEIIA